MPQHLLLIIYLFIWLGLCQVLVATHSSFVRSCRIFPCKAWMLQLWHVGLVAAQHMGSQFPDRGPTKPKSPALQGGLLTTNDTWEVPNKDKEEEHFFQQKGDKDFLFRFIIEHSDRDVQQDVESLSLEKYFPGDGFRGCVLIILFLPSPTFDSRASP